MFRNVNNFLDIDFLPSFFFFKILLLVNSFPGPTRGNAKSEFWNDCSHTLLPRPQAPPAREAK